MKCTVKLQISLGLNSVGNIWDNVSTQQNIFKKKGLVWWWSVMQKCYIIFNSHFILYQEEFAGLDVVRTFLPLCFHSCGLKLASPLALRELDNTLLTTDL